MIKRQIKFSNYFDSTIVHTSSRAESHPQKENYQVGGQVFQKKCVGTVGKVHNFQNLFFFSAGGGLRAVLCYRFRSSDRCNLVLPNFVHTRAYARAYARMCTFLSDFLFD